MSITRQIEVFTLTNDEMTELVKGHTVFIGPNKARFAIEPPTPPNTEKVAQFVDDGMSVFVGDHQLSNRISYKCTVCSKTFDSHKGLALHSHRRDHQKAVRK
jgi:hypothetical protein